MAEFSSHIPTPSSLQVLAQAYGSDAYGSNSYNGQSTPGTATTPLPPNTGLHLPSSVGDIAFLLVIAILVGALSYGISRLLRRQVRSK